MIHMGLALIRWSAQLITNEFAAGAEIFRESNYEMISARVLEWEVYKLSLKARLLPPEMLHNDFDKNVRDSH